MSNPLDKFQYMIEGADTIKIRYTDTAGKIFVFKINEFKFDDVQEDNLIVDYEQLSLDEGLNKDEFNRDFGFFVNNIIEESVKAAEEILGSN